MARSDLVVSLVRASALGDQKIIRGTVEALVAEEHAKNHHLLAEKLWSVYQVTRNKADNIPSDNRSKNKERSLQPELRFNSPSSDIAELLHELRPQRGLADLFLDETILSNCHELIEEQLNADLLRSYATEPRNRIVLAGPPGNGKTSLARAISFELGLPLYVLKYEAIIGSFLGETSNRLKRVFDFVRSRPCVIFFDEFDTLGKERGDANETGEIKRVVSALLLQIDDLPAYNVIVAATNHSELIDRAAWRRFQIRLELLPPGKNQIRLMLADLEREIRLPQDFDRNNVVENLIGLSYSDVEQFLLDIKRRWLLRKENETLDLIVRARVNLLNHRFTIKTITGKNGNSSNTGAAEGDAGSSKKRQSEIF